jgi:hypothetical protein
MINSYFTETLGTDLFDLEAVDLKIKK